MIKRRDILIGLCATCVILGLPGISLAQSGFSTTDLGGNLTLISGAGSNVVIAEGPDSVVVVNGGLQENASALLAEINRLTGNDADNRLDGGAGADVFIGGRGDDTYIVDIGNDRIVELPGEGRDRVISARNYALPDDVEPACR